MAQEYEQGRQPRGGLPVVVIAVVVGAIVAALFGYVTSALLCRHGLGLVTPTEAAGKSMESFLARAGLNFQAIHHIRIAGAGLPGGEGSLSVSILWPISLWAIVPAAALMLGGHVAARIARIRGNFLAGAMIAVPYVIALLVARAWCSAPSVAVALPSLPEAIPQFDPGLVSAMLLPATPSVIFNGLIFGLIFGGIGAVGGPAALLWGLRRSDGIWPGWVRGAFAAAVGGHIVFLAIFAIFLGLWLPGQNMNAAERTKAARSYATLLPTGAAWAQYFAHGVTLTGRVEAKPGIPEASPTVQSYQAGLFSGFASEGKKKPIKPLFFLAMIVPAACLFLAGRMAAVGSESRLGAAAMMAGFYTLLMTAGVIFFTLATSTAIGVGDIVTRTKVVLGPSAKLALPLSLLFAIFFGTLGAIMKKPNARS